MTFTVSESHDFPKLSEMAANEDLDSVNGVTGAADLPVECVTTVLRCEHSRCPQERAWTCLGRLCNLPPAHRLSSPWPLQRRFFTPEEFSRAACVRRQWRCAVENDEVYWEQQCSERFALATPKAFTHKLAETWR